MLKLNDVLWLIIRWSQYKLIAVDSDANALTFERCTRITDMSEYYYEIYDLLLKGITYSRHLAHCDPGPKCTSEKEGKFDIKWCS